MGLLDDAMANDMKFAFLETDEHAEPITYTPINGSAQTINAVVEREIPDDIIIEDIKGPLMIITVANSATTTIGVATASIGDAVAIPLHSGSSNITLYVDRIIEQDSAGWRLLVH